MSRWRIWKEEDSEEEDDDEIEDDKEEDDKGVGTDVQFPFTQPPSRVHTHPNIRKKWKKNDCFPIFWLVLMDGRTDGQTNGWTNRPMDGQSLL